jgi:phospholipid/cholesterol/gamma-HCH transport system permease protein
VVVWFHLHGVVERAYIHKVPEYLALAVVLEFAPLGAGLVVAGRSGASLGAELGSMRLTEQIDALEVLGLSPMRQLVGPRVLACMVALPLMTLYMAFIALAGSAAAELLGGSLSWAQYQADLARGLGQAKAIPAVLKTSVFGYLIAVTGCYYGMTASGGTEGVGRAATRGVVVSTLLVLVSNVVLVKLIQVVW